MELYKIRSRISMGESLYDLPLKVTFMLVYLPTKMYS